MYNYEINNNTLIIFPYSKGKSKVYEYNEEHIVDTHPLNIIKESCLFFGCSFEGRRSAIKEILSIEHKVPILIEESRNIIFFPVNKCINQNSIWISYQNLIKYTKLNDFSTVLYFHNNKRIVVDIKYNLIDKQVIRCLKLSAFLNKRKNFIKDAFIIE